MKKLSYLFFACFISLSLMNCAEDGEPGPAGKDGVDGIDGEDGEDGEGFDEVTQYGNITVYLDGTRLDGVAFKDTSDFEYTAVNELAEYNTAYTSKETMGSEVLPS